MYHPDSLLISWWREDETSRLGSSLKTALIGKELAYMGHACRAHGVELKACPGLEEGWHRDGLLLRAPARLGEAFVGTAFQLSSSAWACSLHGYCPWSALHTPAHKPPCSLGPTHLTWGLETERVRESMKELPLEIWTLLAVL